MNLFIILLFIIGNGESLLKFLPFNSDANRVFNAIIVDWNNSFSEIGWFYEFH